MGVISPQTNRRSLGLPTVPKDQRINQFHCLDIRAKAAVCVYSAFRDG